MTNNDKLKQIISNLQVLTDLTKSMIDSEMYPVSFFSQAFDLIQKIQSDVHSLEASQVDLFAAQMKKHQALILSIHQQMRNISPDLVEQKTVSPPHTAKPATPDNTPPTAVEKTAITSKPATPEQNEDKSKKVSFLSRLGIHKEEKKEESTRPPGNMPQPATTPVTKQNEKPTSTIIEDPIQVPEKKTMVETKPVKPVVPRQTHPSGEVQKKPVTPTPPPVTTPPVKKMKPVSTSETAAKTDITNQKTKPAEVKKVTPASAEVKKTVSIEAPPYPSVKDVIEKKKLSDLRKAFSLNDRFLYRRELFGGSEDAMNKIITILNGKESFKESVDFLEEKLHWDFSNPTVKDFVKILEIRFL